MITEKLLKKVAQKIDDMVDWVKITKRPILGKVLEIADNYALPWGLDYLNDNYGSYIPSQYEDEIVRALEAFVNEDWNGMLAALPSGIDEAIDIKAFDDDFEAVWIATNFNAAVKMGKYIAERNAA